MHLQGGIRREGVLWLLGRLCALLRIPINTVLIALGCCTPVFLALDLAVFRKCDIHVSRLLRVVSVGLILLSINVGALAVPYDCLIEPNQQVELASPVSGLLEKVLVSRGDLITKGQILAQLESHAEQASAELSRFKSEQVGPIRQAESKIEFSKKKFSRRRDMAAQKLMSIQDSDDSEAEYKLSEADLQVAKENKQISRLEFQHQNALLALRTIRSPFVGVVVDQLAYPGEVVEPGATKKAILKVAQLDPLRVHVILPKDVFGKLVVGMPVDVVPEIPSKGRYVAKVRSIDKLIDAASGTFVVFLEMSNPKLEIPAGVRCKASLPGVESNVPRESVTAKK